METQRSLQHTVPIPLASIKAEIKAGLPRVWKEGINDNKYMNQRYNLIGSNASSNLRVNSSLSRKEEILLAQLRSGHCRLLGDFYHKALKKGSLNGICRWCRSKKESVEHIFKECAELFSLRLRFGIFEEEFPLRDKQKDCLKFVRCALEYLGNGT